MTEIKEVTAWDVGGVLFENKKDARREMRRRIAVERIDGIHPELPEPVKRAVIAFFADYPHTAGIIVIDTQTAITTKCL